jgi:hypothetical protein
VNDHRQIGGITDITKTQSGIAKEDQDSFSLTQSLNVKNMLG